MKSLLISLLFLYSCSDKPKDETFPNSYHFSDEGRNDYEEEQLSNSYAESYEDSLREDSIIRSMSSN